MILKSRQADIDSISHPVVLLAVKMVSSIVVISLDLILKPEARSGEIDGIPISTILAVLPDLLERLRADEKAVFQALGKAPLDGISTSNDPAEYLVNECSSKSSV